MAELLTYATIADMVRRFDEQELIELTDTTNIPPSEINEAKVQAAIDDAVATVDGFIGVVYRLPLQGCAKPVTTPGGAIEYAAPPKLTRWVCDIARYNLYDDLAPENEVYRRYKATLAELRSFADHGELLACPWGGSPGDLIGTDPLNPGGKTLFCASPRRITDATVKDYK